MLSCTVQYKGAVYTVHAYAWWSLLYMYSACDGLSLYSYTMASCLSIAECVSNFQCKCKWLYWMPSYVLVQNFDGL